MSTVNAPIGPIHGVVENGIHVFKGIPFAEPPTGDRRWLAPVAKVPWSQPLDATRFGPQAMQAETSPLTGLLGGVQEGIEFSEDCLSLNIWSPACDGGKRPVMVWIHGGAFILGSGSSPMYDGMAFAQRDVVLVSINYRLGTLGFLSLDEATGGAIASIGCEGLLDQIAALRWVNQNIASFGGDPDNVTIFGESAGGMSVGCLMAMPAAYTLYHKAIPQSGACHTASTVDRGPLIARLTAEALGIEVADAAAWRAQTAKDLIAVQDAVQAHPDAGGVMVYQPVADGSHLTQLPIHSIRAGIAAGKAVLVGCTLEENKLFTAMEPAASPSLQDITSQASATYGDEAGERLIDGYRAALSARGVDAEPSDVMSAIGTDQMFRIPALRFAEAQLQHSGDVFVYMFNWTTDFFEGALGSCHALDLPYVFSTHRQPGLKPFAGAGQEGADDLATAMTDAWANFARCGNPGGDKAVPSYAHNRSTLVFGSNTRVEEDAYGAERVLWDGLDQHLGAMG